MISTEYSVHSMMTMIGDSGPSWAPRRIKSLRLRRQQGRGAISDCRAQDLFEILQKTELQVTYSSRSVCILSRLRPVALAVDSWCKWKWG